MTNTLIRLVYRSRSTLHPDNVDALDNIFRTAVRNNLHSNLSGCLAHPYGHFVQVIEGHASDVDTLMERLIVDPRHTDVVVLARCSTPARIFSRWAMARPDLRSLADQSLRLMNDQGTAAQITASLLDLVERGEVRTEQLWISWI